MDIKPLYLLRIEDINGKSGTGVVATGVQLASGRVVIEWNSIVSSINIYNSIAALEDVPSHEGRTKIIMGYHPKKKGRKRKNETT